MRSRCGTPMAGDGVIGGVERKIHFFAFDLPHSDACFVVGYPDPRRRKPSATAMRGWSVMRDGTSSFRFRSSRAFAYSDEAGRRSDRKPATDSDLKPAGVPI